jgi:hypothetical protein
MTIKDNPRQKEVVDHFQSVVDDADKGGDTLTRQPEPARHDNRVSTQDKLPADGVLESNDGKSIYNEEKRHDLTSNGPRGG